MKQPLSTSSKAQAFWAEYCRRHLEKYGEPFGPDVIPGWDQPSDKSREPDADSPESDDDNPYVQLLRQGQLSQVAKPIR